MSRSSNSSAWGMRTWAAASSVFERKSSILEVAGRPDLLHRDRDGRAPGAAAAALVAPAGSHAVVPLFREDGRGDLDLEAGALAAPAVFELVAAPFAEPAHSPLERRRRGLGVRRGEGR